MRKLSANQFIPHQWLKWTGIALFILWLFYCIGAYFVTHKPFSLPVISAFTEGRGSWPQLTFSSSALMRTLLDLGAAGWISLAALGAGNWLLDRIRFNRPSDLDTVLYSLALGFGALGLGTLFLGLSGLLQSTIFFTILILLSILTAPRIYKLLRRLRLPRPNRLINVYLALVLGISLMAALMPPTSWDGLFYHLTGPKLYLAAGRIQPGIDIPHLNFPSLMEMLFMMAMVVRGDVTAQLIHFVFNFMLAGLVYAAARDHLQVKQAWPAVLFLYATPMVLTLASWAYNDLALAFYQAAALYVLLHWRNGRQPGELLLSGILCGLAMGLKYTSFIAPLILVSFILWTYRKAWRQAIRPIIAFTAAASLVAAPWYLKNLIFTGNPVYPFIFGGRFWDLFRSSAYAGNGTGIGFDVITLLRLPYELTLGIGDASFDGLTGPLFLAFLPLLLIYTFTSRRKTVPTAMWLLLIFALAQYLFWTMGVMFSAGLRQSRLLLPAFVMLSPVLAWIWQDLKQLDHPEFSLQRFLNLTIGFVLILGVIGQLLTWIPQAPLAYLIGDQSRDDRLGSMLGIHYRAIEEMNAQLPADAVVQFLWEPRSYYCQVDCRPDSILDTFSHLEFLHGTAGEIAAAWRESGITHVLLYNWGLDLVVDEKLEWVTPRNMGNLNELVAEQMTVIDQWGEYYTLYRLTP